MQKIRFGDLDVLLAAGEAEYRLTLPQVSDVSGGEGISLEAELLEDGPVELEVTLYPLRIARPEFFPYIKGSAAVLGRGVHKVDIPFGQFAFRQMVRAFLSYLDAVSVRILSGGRVKLKSVGIDTFGELEVEAAKASLAGSAGEELDYSVMIRNKASREMMVNISQSRYGRECLEAEYPGYVALGAEETKECTLKVKMTEDIPEGGVEKSEFLFVPDGDGTQMKRVLLYSAKVKKHPYLVLDEEEWARRREAVLGSESLYRTFRQEYEQSAGKWNVPEAAEAESYVYPSYAQDDLYKAVTAWKITGKEEYLRKALRFFEGFLDERKGYLQTKTSYFTFVESREEYARGDFKVHRVQNGGWVQEAEFFNKLAMSYDLLYDCFTGDQHRKIEECFTQYMKFASWRLTDGDGNNFQVAESGAGLLCAMAIQDHGWIHRFLEGYNAYLDLLASVFLDDGMYFEEASGYCRLAGELFFDIVNAAEHFGIPLKDRKVEASYDRNILHAPWAMRETWAEDKKPFLGMSFRRFEKFTGTTRYLKDYFDCMAEILTEHGVMLSVNDSNEQDFRELYKKAYYLYRDPLYREIADLSGTPELLFVPAPERDRSVGKDSVLLEGAGLCLLRDGTAQAALKFGGHGGYHGHYDRLSLASFLRENQTFHNNEYAWFGYDSFLFKMWVQTSVAHNMTVVDGRMQKPSPCRCVYYTAHGKVERRQDLGRTLTDAEEFAAVCAQTTTEWMDPPYGGQTPYPYEFPEEKCAREGRYILPPERKRRQGEIGEYSEPVFQRRLLILFHGYCVVWDYLEGREEHRYDCLYHPMGRFDNEDGIPFGCRERFDGDPFGAGQFIMNCFHAQMEGTVCLKFHEAQPRVNGNDILDHMPEAAVWRAYPRAGSVAIGKYPQKGDTFTEQNRRDTMEYLREPLKKTVSFSDRGKKAGFITVLEAGKETGRICGIQCTDFHSIVIEEKNGERWAVSVEGMDEKEAEVSVKIKCPAAGNGVLKVQREE